MYFLPNLVRSIQSKGLKHQKNMVGLLLILLQHLTSSRSVVLVFKRYSNSPKKRSLKERHFDVETLHYTIAVQFIIGAPKTCTWLRAVPAGMFTEPTLGDNPHSRGSHPSLWPCTDVGHSSVQIRQVL